MKYSVGMAGPKTTPTRFVGIMTSTIYIPTLAFLDNHAPVDGDQLVFSWLIVLVGGGG